MSAENVREAYNDALQFKDETASLFNLGYLTLRERADAIMLHRACLEKMHRLLLVQQRDEALAEAAADTQQESAAAAASLYYINLSIFRSCPDTWAIGQLFPIVPVSRLDEVPRVNVKLADITCDSDGKISCFIGNGSPDPVLRVHELQPGERYVLGMFLTGAYQEVMGNIHNLYGSTNVVHIVNGEDGKPTIGRVSRGQTAREVMRGMNHDGDELLEEVLRSTEASVRQGNLTRDQADVFLANYKHVLEDYTYLSRDAMTVLGD